MISDRPYQWGMARAQALENLSHGAGTQWDQELVAHFVAIEREALSLPLAGLGARAAAVYRAGYPDCAPAKEERIAAPSLQRAGHKGTPRKATSRPTRSTCAAVKLRQQLVQKWASFCCT